MFRASLFVALASLLVVPAIVGAQNLDQEAQLREEFRAALVADPRSTLLSTDELNAMVDSLTQEAKTQNAVDDFVLPPLPVSEVTMQYFDGVVTPWGQPISPLALYGVVLACLLAALLLLWWLLHLHKRHAMHTESA